MVRTRTDDADPPAARRTAGDLCECPTRVGGWDSDATMKLCFEQLITRHMAHFCIVTCPNGSLFYQPRIDDLMFEKAYTSCMKRFTLCVVLAPGSARAPVLLPGPAQVADCARLASAT